MKASVEIAGDGSLTEIVWINNVVVVAVWVSLLADPSSPFLFLFTLKPFVNIEVDDLLFVTGWMAVVVIVVDSPPKCVIISPPHTFLPFSVSYEGNVRVCHLHFFLNVTLV